MRNKSVMMPGETLKWCSRCATEKPPEEFSKNRHRIDGLQNYCKPCSVKTQRETNAKHPEARDKRVRKSFIKRKYGLTVQQFDTMMFDQNGKCAICNHEMDHPNVNRDQGSGDIRALLCDTCHKGISLFGDSIENLFRAISYLDSFKVVETSAVRIEV